MMITENQLRKRERELEEAGYHKSRNTSSTNDYSWFKTIKGKDDWLYMIEWRIWDFSKYAHTDPSLLQRGYSIELCVIVNRDDCSPHVNFGDTLGIKGAESFAREFYQLVKTFKPNNHEKD